MVKKMLALFFMVISINVIAVKYIGFEIDKDYIIAKTEDDFYKYYVKKDLKSNKFFGRICTKSFDFEEFTGAYSIFFLDLELLLRSDLDEYCEIELGIAW